MWTLRYNEDNAISFTVSTHYSDKSHRNRRRYCSVYLTILCSLNDHAFLKCIIIWCNFKRPTLSLNCTQGYDNNVRLDNKTRNIQSEMNIIIYYIHHT